MSTRDRLVTEAALLLDAGGQGAVTLRAVAQAVGVSHNAPYRHFTDRSALLAAIAERDFATLLAAFDEARASGGEPIERLQRGVGAFIRYGRNHPARYRLLFSDPAIAATGGSLEEAALAAFRAFAALVEEWQADEPVRTVPTRELAGLIYATAHGLLDLQTGGRMREQKGLFGVEQSVSLLLDLLGSARSP